VTSCSSRAASPSWAPRTAGREPQLYPRTHARGILRGSRPLPLTHRLDPFRRLLHMARPVYGRDRKLQARMAGTLFSLGLLYVIGFGALFVLFPSYLAFWAVIALALLIGQVWFSDKLALAASGARIVTPQQAPELHAMIDRLCITANLPKPKVA